MTDSETIYHFYECMQDRNVEGMLSCYHPKIKFTDPVFGELEGDRVFNMWRMLMGRIDPNAKIEINNVYALNNRATCKWTADYAFGKRKRQIHNKIKSDFKFKDNRIVEQFDYFNLWEWTKQALGITGHLFGWSLSMQKMIIKQNKEYLNYYMEKHG
ncbi:MAG: limonene-1,2-epoxide hydrolase [Bacteroidia bacterium]|jgi:limonene-1,2-epoxide hydrolase